MIKSHCLPLNTIQTGIFEVLLTIMRQLKDITVKGGFFNDNNLIWKHLYISNEDHGFMLVVGV